jgi:hypothetical protein
MQNNIENKNLKVKPENKYCPLIFNKGKYSLSIISLDYGLSKNNEFAVFLVPIREFLACGSIWETLHLCTIFWETPAYNRTRSANEIQQTKAAYLIAFASDLAPICKQWANECINNTIKYIDNEDTVYAQIECFNETLKEKMIKAISAYNLNLSIADNKYTVFS